MLVAFGVLWAVCLVETSVLTAVLFGLLEKPYYDVENAVNLFENYVKQYNKVYNLVEYLERLEIFKDNLRDINKRNAKYPMTVFGINQFTDLKSEEMKKYYGFKLLNETITRVLVPDGPPAPEFLDWRDQHVVTHVKDQGECGCCYIFSAVGNIEGQYAMKHEECLAFSEAQALDCLDIGTCDGGIMDEVMSGLSKTPGLEKEDDYPYQPVQNQCRANHNKVVAKVRGGKVLSIPDENVLKQKLSDIGPLAVAIAAHDLNAYYRGILLPALCIGRVPDHAVLLVGYGEENGLKYWILKNTWGENWGESGYVRLLRGVNACQMGTSYTATADVA